MLYADTYVAGDEVLLQTECRQLLECIVRSDVDDIKNLHIKPKFRILVHSDLFQRALGPLKHISTETEESRVGEAKRDVEHTYRHATSFDVAKNRVSRLVIFNLVSGCLQAGGVPVAGDGLIALFEQEPRVRDMIDVSIVDRLGKRKDGDLRFAVVGERSHNPIAHGPGHAVQLPDALAAALPANLWAVSWHVYKGVCFSDKIVKAGGYFAYQQGDGQTCIGQLLGAIQPALELDRVNVESYCIVRPLPELQDVNDARHRELGARFELDPTEPTVALRLTQLVDIPDMIHACWELGCSVQVERNTRVRRERAYVNGDVEKWVHEDEGIRHIYVRNPFRHGGAQVR